MVTFVEQLQVSLGWPDLGFVSSLDFAVIVLYSRFLVVDDEADHAFVSWRPVVLPRQPNGVARCDVGLELQDVTFTCLNRWILNEGWILGFSFWIPQFHQKSKNV